MNIIGEFEILLITGSILIGIFVVFNLYSTIKLIIRLLRRSKSRTHIPQSFNVQFKRILFKILPKLEGKGNSLRIITNFFRKGKFFFINILLLLLFILVLHFLFYPKVFVSNTYPNQRGAWSDYEKPVEIVFNRPIVEGELELHLSHDIIGEWEFIRSVDFLPFVRAVRFHPEESLPPDMTFRVYVVNFNPARDIGEHEFIFTSALLPQILSLSPGDMMIDIEPETYIEINFNNPNGKFVDWEFKITPSVEFDIDKNSAQQIKLIPKKNLKQTTRFKVELYRTPQVYKVGTDEVLRQGYKQKIHETYFTTIKAPLIESFIPEGTGILPDQKIKVVFDEPIYKEDVEERFSIEPFIDGELEWEGDRAFAFTPDNPLTKETNYSVRFGSGIRSKIGGSIDAEIEFEFETVGTVKVLSMAPSEGSEKVDITNRITVKFDQKVDQTSAQNHFKILPDINGTFSWKNNIMIFTPLDPLAFETKYQVTISPKVKTINGFDSKKQFTTSFTTRSQTFILNVVYSQQSHAFSCNADAVSMVMNYKGVPTTDADVYNNAGTGPQGAIPHGNPHKGWVSNYGLYWEVALSYVQSKGLNADIYHNWDLTSALKEVENGNPVMIWWQNGSSSPTVKSYTAADGQFIFAVNGMHSVVIVGFSGTPDAPTQIFYHDPWFGANLSRTSASFDYLWSSWRVSSIPSSYSRVAMVVR